MQSHKMTEKDGEIFDCFCKRGTDHGYKLQDIAPEDEPLLAKLEKVIREMFDFEKEKPAMTVLVMGNERPDVSWEEAKDDLSRAIALHVVLDLFPKWLADQTKETNHE